MLFWEEWKADPDAGRDELGPPWSKFRLWFPTWLIGEDFVRNKRGTFEEKVVARMSKLSKMTDEECAAVRSEVSRGFKRPFSSDEAVASMHRSLPAQALTMEGSDDTRQARSSGDIVREVVESCGLISPSVKVQPPSKDTVFDAAAPSLQTTLASQTDIKLARSESWRSLRADVTKKKISWRSHARKQSWPCRRPAPKKTTTC